MSTVIQILEIVVWPLTIIVLVLFLRAPLIDLIPTLKKLKYKDLELEFEREAGKILAEAERDLITAPRPEEKTKLEGMEEPKILFSVEAVPPIESIMESWSRLESEMRRLAGSKNYSGASVGTIASKLREDQIVSEEIYKLILDLASLRNRVAHAEKNVITYDVSNPYRTAANLVAKVLRERDT